MMKIRESFGAIIVCLLIGIVAVSPSAFAASSETSPRAEALQKLEILKGSPLGLELDKKITRAEGTVVILRLMGLEAKARDYNGNVHFRDVPKNHWAEKYIDFAYDKGIVKGVSSTAFDPEKDLSCTQCLALILRVLGYNGAAPKDAVQLAENTGLMSSASINQLLQEKFLRMQVADILYSALTTNLKDSNQTLIAKLIAEKKINETTAISLGLYEKQGNTVQTTQVTVQNTDEQQTAIPDSTQNQVEESSNESNVAQSSEDNVMDLIENAVLRKLGEK